jgi:hypothetical protein
MTGTLGERFNADDEFIVDQQAYYETADGAITWKRVLCSGWLSFPGRGHAGPTIEGEPHGHFC